ncbi:Hypothetical protein MALK_4300 [Metamycoplasma alkalescens 14918]|uniref:Spermidine/putrescine transport system substrate-binding protein n=1 Tax=Metamycoplasma alkalescens 14918 TaxID=1188234 RepID=N9UAY1_9BACT|nr:hypothetical protein [Metamycoplasma alkalescens]ENY53826.1 Hypothetical protein MALK_4300 [Metamycoplasma alkalescens 14918]
MNKRIFKFLLSCFAIVFLIFLFFGSIILKLSNKYRPSIYNYESYLSPEIIKKIGKNYNYKEFKEVSEFTQVLTQDKAIAGVGSDFQAAQLILDKKIKKIDYTKIFGNNSNTWQKRKKLFTKTIQNHLENFDNLIYSKLANMEDKGNKIGFEIDANNKRWRSFETKQINENNWDHFSDFIIPYYSQDKGIAYNINKETRPHLNIEDEINHLEEKTLQIDWKEIFSILKNNNYQRIGWTNAYIDNLMIGAMNSGDDWIKNFTLNGEGKLFDFNENNYKDAIKSFVKFVEHASGKPIRNTKYNFLSGDGLELLNHLIEPKSGRSDAAVIYNGDGLDGYYSKDNFESVEEGKIRFIRPKNNYILMDGWIISHKLSEDDTNKFLETLRINIYHNNHKYSDKKTYEEKLDQLENDFIAKVKENINENKEKHLDAAKEVLKNIFNNQEEKNQIIEKLNENEKFKNNNWKEIDNWNNQLENFVNNENSTNKDWLLIIRNNSDDGASIFEEAFSNTFADIELSEIGNFDYISYTPADQLTYEFIEKWYFGNDETAKSIYSQPEPIKNQYSLFTYPIIDNNLRTKIVSYYFELTKS